jgi:hypothetical protein
VVRDHHGEQITIRVAAKRGRHHLSNRVFDSYKAVVKACCSAWTNLIAEAGRIASVATRSWATIGQSP